VPKFCFDIFGDTKMVLVDHEISQSYLLRAVHRNRKISLKTNLMFGFKFLVTLLFRGCIHFLLFIIYHQISVLSYYDITKMISFRCS